MLGCFSRPQLWPAANGRTKLYIELTMKIGVPAEITAGKKRVAVTPETVEKLKGQGHTVSIQSGDSDVRAPEMNGDAYGSFLI